MADVLLVVVLLLNFCSLGASRLRVMILAAAAQGAVLGCLAILLHGQAGLRVVLLGVATVVVKGIVIPRALFFAIREVQIRREVEPLLGFAASLILGAVGTTLAAAFARSLPLAEPRTNDLIVPASLATVFTGFLVLTTRRKAITQVVGYLLLEKGIYLFGLLLLEALPLVVEAGVLLDLFVGVFVMGIVIHHINREFASVSTEHLTSLRG